MKKIAVKLSTLLITLGFCVIADAEVDVSTINVTRSESSQSKAPAQSELPTLKYWTSISEKINAGKVNLKNLEGGVHGGGGTSISLEFAYIGSRALLILADEKVLSKGKAEEVSKSTSVFDVESICTQNPNNGQLTCLDAQYISQTNKIEFDRNQWAKKACEEKFSLSAHEYLRAAGLEDSAYQYSRLFFGGLSNRNTVLVENICADLRRKKNAQTSMMALPRNAVDLIIAKDQSLPQNTEEVLRSYLNNHCYFSLSVADAVLETAEVKLVSSEPIAGYSDNVRQFKLKMNLSFGSDEVVYEREQTIILENTSGSYQIIQSSGVCNSIIRHD